MYRFHGIVEWENELIFHDTIPSPLEFASSNPARAHDLVLSSIRTCDLQLLTIHRKL